METPSPAAHSCRRWSALLLCCVLSCCIQVAGAGDPLPRIDPATRRHLDLGTVIGYTAPKGAQVWLGLPYALPPVEERRWRSADPPLPWQGTRIATQAAAPCSQPARPPATGVTGSEDCLYLNIHAPANAGQDSALPVMVWLHGGANLRGNAAEYDGSVLASTQNVIVVTVGYRLGILGWFSHPALRSTARHAEDASGNYGTLDQIQALRWVQSHIAAFGGDPSRITIFGESAGGSNVYALLTAPAAKGLFHRAIVQSGAMVTAPPEAERRISQARPEKSRACSERKDIAEEGAAPGVAGKLLRELLTMHDRAADPSAAEHWLATAPPEDIRAFLERQSVDDLHRALAALTMRCPGMAWPTLFRDGAVLPGQGIHAALAAGHAHRVPIMLGSTRDEFTILLPILAGNTELLAVEKGSGRITVPDKDRYLQVAEYLSRFLKATMVDEPARLLQAQDHAPALFVYRFDWDELAPAPWLDDLELGATHGLDVPFVFGHRQLGPEYVQLPLIRPESNAHFHRLAAIMMSYWAQFAATGDPGTGRQHSLPAWRPWQEQGDSSEQFMILDIPERGGLEMSRNSLTRHAVLMQMLSDPRLGRGETFCDFLVLILDLGQQMGLALHAGDEPPHRCSIPARFH